MGACTPHLYMCPGIHTPRLSMCLAMNFARDKFINTSIDFSVLLQREVKKKKVQIEIFFFFLLILSYIYIPVPLKVQGAVTNMETEKAVVRFQWGPVSEPFLSLLSCVQREWGFI